MAHGARHRSLAGKVPVAVVGEVNDRRPVCRCLVVDHQRVRIVEAVGRIDGERAGIAFVAIAADIAQGDTRRCSLTGSDDLPNNLVEALGPAMERIGAVVHRHRIGLALQREPAARDAVGETSDGGAEILRLVEVLTDIGIAEQHVSHAPGTIRHHQRLQAGAIADHPRRHTVRVGQHHRWYRRAVGHRAERLALGGGGVRARQAQHSHRGRHDHHPLRRPHRHAPARWL